ncbi:MAG: protein phosphatase CheZ [Nitrospiraceae bacterium]|nr:protein phosphatase CheZ [Nitrospiraceae bacterium]
MEQFIGFKLGSMEYTIPILKVREIINAPVITRMPQSPDYIEGVTNLRGSIIVIVNLKSLLNMHGENGGAGGKIIVISSGKITFGVLVDGITGVIEIDGGAVEHPERFFSEKMEQIKGVAKINDKLLVLLDPKKLIPFEDMALFEEEVFEIAQGGPDGQVEVTRNVHTMGGDVKVTEVHEAKEFFGKKLAGDMDGITAEIMQFLDAIDGGQYEKAEAVIQSLMQKGQNSLYKEVGKVTRKLHDSVKGFKEAIDPRLKDMATTDMPKAMDRLQYVIDKTEEAANGTMAFVEKYILCMDELSAHIRNIREPEETVSYLKDFRNKLEDDLTEVLTTQSFQDLTGQTLKKVMGLVSDVETELVGLIANFGVKIEQCACLVPAAEMVNQEGVDKMLTELGF